MLFVMGLRLIIKQSCGVRISGNGVCLDVIVRGVSGDSIERRSVELEVRQRSSGYTKSSLLHLSYLGGLYELGPGIRVGVSDLVEGHETEHDAVPLHFKVDRRYNISAKRSFY